MTPPPAFVTTVLGLTLAGFTYQSAAAQTAQGPPSGPCLTTAQRDVNTKYYALTRPTSRDDEMPFWDPEYFAGVWDFESRLTDSPLGPGGESTGTVTIKSAGGCKYEGEMNGEDPDGKPFTRKITFTYDNVGKQLAWTEVDSRRYTIVKSGPVGGELGGLFHHHFEDAAPITMAGKKIRLRGVTEMSSPAFYKSDMQISIDGGPLKTFGRATFEKRLR